MIKVGVIGGGASGMMAAITAAENGAFVTILEKKERLGKKILVTGNGRCNYSNENMGENYYYTEDPSFVKKALSAFDNRDLLAFFNSLGILSKNKNGYYYPVNEQAATVLEAFELAVRDRQIDVLLNADVSTIDKTSDGFKVVLSDGKTFYFDKIIISAGGKSSLGKNEQYNGYYLVKGLGHTITKVCPALTSLKCEGFDFKTVSGVRNDSKLSLYVDGVAVMEDYGEVVFNDNGISGIVTFQISHCAIENARAEKDVKVIIDLLPGLSETELESFAYTKYLTHSEYTAYEYFVGFVNKKFILPLLKLNGIEADCIISKLEFDRVRQCLILIKNLTVNVKGDASFTASQVTAGGVPLDEIKDSFESKICDGLFLTGELLDVDGICGGYNLQWAFTSGYIAGLNASEKL